MTPPPTTRTTTSCVMRIVLGVLTTCIGIAISGALALACLLSLLRILPIAPGSAGAEYIYLDSAGRFSVPAGTEAVAVVDDSAQCELHDPQGLALPQEDRTGSERMISAAWKTPTPGIYTLSCRSAERYFVPIMVAAGSKHQVLITHSTAHFIVNLSASTGVFILGIFGSVLLGRSIGRRRHPAPAPDTASLAPKD